MKGAPFRLVCEQAPKWSLCTDPPPLSNLYTGYPSGTGQQRKSSWPLEKNKAPGLASLASFLVASLHLGACSQVKDSYFKHTFHKEMQLHQMQNLPLH